MVDLSFTEEQVAFRESILKFAKKELNNNLIENDEKATFSWENWKKCADMGLLSLLVPKKHGGQGADLLTNVLSMEALSYACRDSGLVHAIGTQICCIVQISLFASDFLKQAYLPELARGEKMAAQAITEPEAGSDVLSIQTKAQKTDNGYVLNGTKMFITNGPLADVIIVFVVTNPQKKKFGGISCFMVDKETKGFSRGNPLNKIGLRTLQNCELIFEDCLVPSDKLLGKESQGMIIFNEQIEWERTLLSAAYIGTMERVLESCINHVKTRSQFGQPIGKFQSISNKIADMKVNIELGKLILYKAAWLKDQKKRVPLETSIGKLFISESLKNACLEAIQIHGGYGYMKEFEIERELRDSIASTIYSGTSELQKNIISSLASL
jgi:alkylation response protein AidB-like acyl-CoA dehydrogenase